MMTETTAADLAAHLRDHATRYTLGRMSEEQISVDLVDLYDLALDVGMDDVAEGIGSIPEPAEATAALRRIAAELDEA